MTTRAPAALVSGGVARGIRYEWVRFSTLRSSYWAAGWIVALSLLFGVSLGMDVRGLPENSRISGDLAFQNLNLAAEFTGIPLIGLIVGILGICSMTHEHRYGTIRPLFVAIPRRADVVLAKVYVISGAAAAATALSCLIVVCAAMAVSTGRLIEAAPGTGGILLAISCYFAVVVLCAIAGIALGTVTRSSAVAIALWLVFPLLGETTIYLVVHGLDSLQAIAAAADWLPFRAAQKGVASTDFENIPRRLLGVLVFTAWVSGLAAAAFHAVQRRDA
ncbi:ABC transporter permease subunit [Streptomyces sp. A3M-1-3]|uniref:ABC transporter permease n=1 Tax=Streptomyces sp. A3M-1-3 TaxID=2962044 RepID=UPI0020B7996C|nr:ABC transporter permease [Streptomyces sp. A3M-1-3]MCP3816820.1 ABC transporter permease subunit [Streptomyces sp. A3M-1-3]